MRKPLSKSMDLTGQRETITAMDFRRTPGAAATPNICHLVKLNRAVLQMLDGFQRRSGGAVAPAGIEEDEINIRHHCFIPASHRCHARALKR